MVLHDHNIIHRDIKPPNIMLAHEGQVKLVDLGLAKCMGEDSGGLTADYILGTLLYMPPEQLDCSRTVDGRADIYALGATLFDTLTDQPPVKGRSLIEILRCHQLPKRRPSEINPSISATVDALCLRMLAADPEDRFQSAESVRNAVDACRTKRHGPLSSPPGMVCFPCVQGAPAGDLSA